MAVEFKDYYKSLGVSRTATDEEIRKSFRKLARQYHPDVATNKAAAEEKFKEINEAYEVLSDPEKRRKYDALEANWKQPGGFRPPPGWEDSRTFRRSQPGTDFEFQFGGTGFSDFFEQFFGGARGPFGGFGSDQAEPAADHEPFGPRGNDVESDILVTLNEALNGSIRTITFRRINAKTRRDETETFRVRIPPGVQEKQLIRVAGKGEAPIPSGTPGDLYLRVKLAKHPDFRVREADLYHDLELAPWEAVLGTTVSVPTLEGPVSLRIPAGVVAGQQLRLRGKGLPARRGSRGDLFAVVSIQVPKHLSEPERAAWEELARASKFNPRTP